MSRTAPLAPPPGSPDPFDAVSRAAAHPVLADADGYFPRVARAAPEPGPAAAMGPRTSTFVTARGQDMDAFADEVAPLAEFALLRADMAEAFRVTVEDTRVLDEVGRDFGGAWSMARDRFVSFRNGVARDADAQGDETDDHALPVHLYCRADGAIYLVVVDEDDRIAPSRRHSLDRVAALSYDVRHAAERAASDFVLN